MILLRPAAFQTDQVVALVNPKNLAKDWIRRTARRKSNQNLTTDKNCSRVSKLILRKEY